MRLQQVDADSAADVDHYLQARLGANVVFATTHRLGNAPAASFASWEELGTVEVPLYPDFKLQLFLYRGAGFRGYSE